MGIPTAVVGPQTQTGGSGGRGRILPPLAAAGGMCSFSSNTQVMMHIQRADGSVGVVTGWTAVQRSQEMYNLEVDQDHTFVVGSGQWVVHNQCSSDQLGRRLVQHYYLARAS